MGAESGRSRWPLRPRDQPISPVAKNYLYFKTSGLPQKMAGDLMLQVCVKIRGGQNALAPHGSSVWWLLSYFSNLYEDVQAYHMDDYDESSWRWLTCMGERLEQQLRDWPSLVWRPMEWGEIWLSLRLRRSWRMARNLVWSWLWWRTWKNLQNKLKRIAAEENNQDWSLLQGQRKEQTMGLGCSKWHNTRGWRLPFEWPQRQTPKDLPKDLQKAKRRAMARKANPSSEKSLASVAYGLMRWPAVSAATISWTSTRTSLLRLPPKRKAGLDSWVHPDPQQEHQGHAGYCNSKSKKQDAQHNAYDERGNMLWNNSEKPGEKQRLLTTTPDALEELASATLHSSPRLPGTSIVKGRRERSNPTTKLGAPARPPVPKVWQRL